MIGEMGGFDKGEVVMVGGQRLEVLILNSAGETSE
jgi:hypothetical protein